MDFNTELLNYIFQNSQMGQHTISHLLEVAEDDEFLHHLNTQLQEYNGINRQAQEMIEARGGKEKDINALAKLSSAVSINVKTLTDNTPSRISEMMLQGSIMGIVDMLRKLREYEGTESEIYALGEKLLHTEESNMEHLKAFI